MGNILSVISHLLLIACMQISLSILRTLTKIIFFNFALAALHFQVSNQVCFEGIKCGIVKWASNPAYIQTSACPSFPQSHLWLLSFCIHWTCRQNLVYSIFQNLGQTTLHFSRPCQNSNWKSLNRSQNSRKNTSLKNPNYSRENRNEGPNFIPENAVHSQE